MQHTTLLKDSYADCSVENGEGPRSLMPYKSPFGGYNYYPTKLFKRRASSTQGLCEGDSVKKSYSPSRTGESFEKNGGDFSRGKSNLKGRVEHGLTTTPLLRRYRQNETKQRRGKGNGEGDFSREVVVDEGKISVPASLASPHRSGGSSNTVEKMQTNEEFSTKGRKFPPYERVAKGIKSSEQRGMQPGRQATLSCPPALQRGKSLGHEEATVFGRKKEINVVPHQTCPDTSCIHGRQAILDFVDLQRELRDCYDALQEKDAEIERLEVQLHSIQVEKADFESRFQLEKQEIERQWTEIASNENKYRADWQRRVLEEQFGSQERYKGEIEKLKEELEQERSGHAHTRGALKESENVCLVLKRQIETLQKVLDSSSTCPKKGNLSEIPEDLTSPERQSPSSMPAILTPRRQPPTVPQPAGEDDFIFEVDVSKTSPQKHKVPSGHLASSVFSFNRPLLETAPANSTINISDPSIALSAVFELETYGEDHSLLGETKHDLPMGNKTGGYSEGYDGGMQRETEDSREVEGKLPSNNDRGSIQSGKVVPMPGIQWTPTPLTNSFLSSALCDTAVGVHPSPVHPFEYFAGQESLLCKELLRALLDKEKQLAELASERKVLGGGGPSLLSE